MNMLEIFDKLMADRRIALYCGDSGKPDTLRVSLSRKFQDYKKQMGALGFLDQETKHCVLSMEWDSEARTARFFIRPRQVRFIEYQILEESEQQDGKEI